MSQENVEIVRRFFEVQGDPGEMLECFDPDVVVANFESAPDNETYVGHDGLRAWSRDVWSAIGVFRLELDEIIDVDEERVVIVNRLCGTGRTSGLPVEIPMAGVLTFGGNKIVAWQAYETREKALEDVGLSE